jgi:hypothetical protein
MGKYLDEAKDKSKKDTDRELFERILANQYIIQEMLRSLDNTLLRQEKEMDFILIKLDERLEDEEDEDYEGDEENDKRKTRKEMEDMKEEIKEETKREIRKEKEKAEKERIRKEFRNKHGGSEISTA